MKPTLRNIFPMAMTILLSAVATTGCGDRYTSEYRKLSKLSGDELKSALNALTEPQTEESPNFYNYNQLATQYKTSDNDPDKEGNVILFYTSKSYEWFPWGQMGTDRNSVQREHVWPQSRFRVYGVQDDTKLSPYNDAHNVRPAWGADNMDHSNYLYGEGEYLFDPNTLAGADLEHSYRGDIARILFYMAVRYDKLEIIDDDNAATGLASYQIGKLSYLLKWNLDNPVSQREIHRNDAIYKGRQGNRNPFIDHPEYACKIWGLTNDATKGICGL